MNLTAINFGAKIAAGIGVNQIVSAACKSVMPEATNIAQSIFQEIGVIGLTGVACDMVSDHIDRTQASILQCVKTIKEARKPKEEA